jgi:Arc/MetJ family transcription regulator
MRLRVHIDDELLAEAKRVLGVSRTKTVVEQALRELVAVTREARERSSHLAEESVGRAEAKQGG